MSGPLLRVDGLEVSAGDAPLVRDVGFDLSAGQRLGIIGESGSGKTLTALSIMGLLPDGLRATGSIELDGVELLALSEGEMCAVRGNSVSMIFQEPMTALNPVMRVGRQIAESLEIHRRVSGGDAEQRAVELLESVGVEHPDRRARAFPHQLSGGQRQRVMIAIALACGPKLVIADEPTTALDVTVQAQVLRVLRDRVVADDTSLILITHDLPVVASVTDHVVVMRDGEIIEAGPTSDVVERPRHPDTVELVESVPPMSRSRVVAPRERTEAEPHDAVVVVDGVSKRYRLPRRHVFEAAPHITAVDDVSLTVQRGQTFGIVGESGSGKSTLARIMVGLVPPTSGSVTVDGIDVGTDRKHSRLHHTAQMVFQDPMGSLDPRIRVGDIVAEPLRSLRIDGDHGERVRFLLDAVELPADSVDRYPHEFSGGQRQRIAIARALAPNPRLLVADEPVSALDMSVQTVTLDLLAELRERFRLTLVFISHDLSVVHEICDEVVVLRSGAIVEQGHVDDVMLSPEQPYTQALIDAIPRLDGTFLAR